MKKIKTIIGIAASILLFFSSSAVANGIVATDNPFKVCLNGEEVNIKGYNIDGNTYFKLRSVASIVGGFNVDFVNDTIIISDGEYSGGNTDNSAAYTGGESIALQNPYSIFYNGTDVDIEGYNINGETYFKLRDVSSVVGGFNVDFFNNVIQLAKDGYDYKNEDFSKYIGVFRIDNGSVCNTLCVKEITDKKAVFYFDSVSLNRLYFRGPFIAQLNDYNYGEAWGKNSYYGEYENYMIQFDGDYIYVKLLGEWGSETLWAFNINTCRDKEYSVDEYLTGLSDMR